MRSSAFATVSSESVSVVEASWVSACVDVDVVAVMCLDPTVPKAVSLPQTICDAVRYQCGALHVRILLRVLVSVEVSHTAHLVNQRLVPCMAMVEALSHFHLTPPPWLERQPEP